ncbi:MAG TPA: pseudouridine synthase [Candidatus Acidoferrum sp.]|jgi:23S rRNA pseudouridine955/2504/2580 synthase|nr:pseudouridine synthase [Candidatus Acidoferrum sp.]
MDGVIKLSSPATSEFWEIPVLYEDDHLLALNKPSGIPSSPDRHAPERPNLMSLLHAGITAAKPWARDRRLSYLMNAHRLDSETSGIILLAKSKPVLVTLANLLGEGKPHRRYVALVQGVPAQDRFEVDAKLAPHLTPAGFVRVDPRRGKHARTVFEAQEKFVGWTLLRCGPCGDRRHQIRAHLRQARLPLAGDALYGGKPLFLSSLKPGFRLKPKHVERSLIDRAALHAEDLVLPQPVTGEPLQIHAPWPKDLLVALKYLRRYAATGM